MYPGEIRDQENYRYRSCTRKEAHETWMDARETVVDIYQYGGEVLRVYRCAFGEHWHTTHKGVRGAANRKRLEKSLQKAVRKRLARRELRERSLANGQGVRSVGA